MARQASMILLFLVALPLSAAAQTTSNKSLYDRLGGLDAIKAVVDEFAGRVATDDRINKKFANNDMRRLKSFLVQQLCAKTGGPCKYTGLDMKKAHKNMKITKGEFNAFIGDFITTLDKFNISAQEGSDLLTILWSLEHQIVEAPGNATGISLRDFMPLPFFDGLGHLVSYDSGYPEFPWPPPTASCFADIPLDFLSQRKGQTYLRDLSVNLKAALNQAGYEDLSWYEVPGGFAIDTRMEQFNDDGVPLSGKDRWLTDVAPAHISSLSDYLTNLFMSRQGHFRAIVFIVTHQPLMQGNKKMTRDEAIDLLPRGLSQLRESIGNRPLSSSYKCTALIYEFEQATPDHPAFFKQSSLLTGIDHLKKSGIWRGLEK